VSAELVPENLPEVWNPPPGVERAALAFSAMPTRAALKISARLTLVERTQLREGLSRIHDIGENERREALNALVRAVHAGVGFPAPAPHDEAKCPFRRVESTPAAEVAPVFAACAQTQPLVAATALCHLRPSYRSEVWGLLSAAERAAIQPTLSQIPGLSATRTAMYALDLRDRIAHRR
jgi:hypothetical protein